jgi:hypothetical protein
VETTENSCVQATTEESGKYTHRHWRRARIFFAHTGRREMLSGEQQGATDKPERKTDFILLIINNLLKDAT